VRVYESSPTGHFYCATGLNYEGTSYNIQRSKLIPPFVIYNIGRIERKLLLREGLGPQRVKSFDTHSDKQAAAACARPGKSAFWLLEEGKGTAAHCRPLEFRKCIIGNANRQIMT
jgi:hypothetical protein